MGARRVRGSEGSEQVACWLAPSHFLAPSAPLLPLLPLTPLTPSCSPHSLSLPNEPLVKLSLPDILVFVTLQETSIEPNQKTKPRIVFYSFS